jgi:hypothetical protein
MSAVDYWCVGGSAGISLCLCHFVELGPCPCPKCQLYHTPFSLYSGMGTIMKVGFANHISPGGMKYCVWGADRKGQMPCYVFCLVAWGL